jgi:predicted PurR-regulated permease PerM
MTVRTAAIVVLSASLTIYALHEGAALLIPILVSVLLAYALEPAVELFMRARLPRVAAAAVVYLLLAVAAGSLARVAIDQINGFLTDLPDTIRELQRAASADSAGGGRPSALDHVRRAAQELAAASPRPAPGGVTRIAPVKRRFDLHAYVMNASFSLVAAGVRVIVVVLLTFLLLASGDTYKRKLMTLAGPRLAERKVTLDVVRTIDRQIERYILVRLLISGIVAAATGIGLSYVGLPHAFVWGAIAGALNVLPFVGPTSAVILITLSAFLQFRALEPTAIAGAVAAGIAVIEGNLISPWLTGRAGELNTVAVFVSVLFWGWMWGMWGLLLAVPIMVAIKAAADRIEALQPLGELLAR